MLNPSRPNFPEKKRIALVVGVDSVPASQVPALRTLLNANNDAQQMAQVLQEDCGFTLLQPPLIGEAATSGEVKKALLSLAEDRMDDDFLLFYFSGHGHPISYPDNHSTDVFLGTHDFKVSDAEGNKTSHLSLGWLREHLYISSDAGKVLIILDCCYAGYIERVGIDPYLNDMSRNIDSNKYFEAPRAATGGRNGRQRFAITATGHTQVAFDANDHGLMTKHLLDALRGNVPSTIQPNTGFISLPLVHEFLFEVMPESQKPSISGGSAARPCWLAWHARRASAVVRPNNYIPLIHNPFFQSRPDELDGHAKLPTMLLQREADLARRRPHIVGLVGMNGIGKTCLALELAHYYIKQKRFLDGIFWINASKNDPPSYKQFAELAEQTHFLPPNDQLQDPENVQRRARHFCNYLAEHKDALLILDDIGDPPMIRSIFSAIIGKELLCTILYTSSITVQPDDAIIYKVDPLKDTASLHLLLASTRPKVLQDIQGNIPSSETAAARDICRIVSNFPFALNQLRSFLTQDPRVSLQRLRERLTQQGVLDVLNMDMSMTTTNLNWELVHDEKEQRMFKLLSYRSASAPMPLWLLGCTSGLGENSDIFSPLGRVYQDLVKLSLLEVTLDDDVWLHPLLRDFGQKLLALDSDKGSSLLAEAGQNLVMEFADISHLQERMRNIGYWQCLRQVRIVRDYLRDLHSEHATTIERIETWLDRESALLANGSSWPQLLPDLFYQQMYNRAVEEGTLDMQFFARAASAHWLRLEQSSGLEDYALQRVLSGHDKGVKCVAFSADGRWLLTGSSDATARIWDSENGQCLHVLRGHTGSINSIAFSSNQRLVLTGSDDETVRIWESESGNHLQTLQGHRDSVRLVAFSQDDKQILTAAGKTVRIWESTKEELPRQFSCSALALNQRWRIVGAQQSSIGIWDAERKTLLARLGVRPTDVTSAAIANNEHLVALGTIYNTVQIWNYVDHKHLKTLPGHDGWISCVAFSPDERHVATGSDDSVARVWDYTNGEKLFILPGHTEHINAVAFSPNGQRIVTASNDKTARIWTYTHEQLSQNRRGMLSPAKESNAQEQKEERQWIAATRGINCIVFSPNGELVVISRVHENIARVWDRRRDALLTLLKGGHTDEIITVAFSQNGEQIATFSRDGRASIWTSTTGELLFQWACGYGVTNSMFSPTGSEILTTSGRHALLWTIKKGQPITTFSGHDANVKSVMFFPNGERIISSSEDTTARIWDVKTAQPIAFLKHSKPVLNALLIGEGQRILTCTIDNIMRVWDWENERVLEEFSIESNNPYMISISPDANLIAMCDVHGQLVLLKGNALGEREVWGTYMAHAVSTLYWLDNTHIVLASIRHAHDGLYFHRLTLEGLE